MRNFERHITAFFFAPVSLLITIFFVIGSFFAPPGSYFWSTEFQLKFNKLFPSNLDFDQSGNTPDGILVQHYVWGQSVFVLAWILTQL